jgi:hypothetical protein
MNARRTLLGTLAYLLPTFVVGYVWHLQLFSDRYTELEIYRSDVIIPFGFASMAVQGLIFSALYGVSLSGAPLVRGAARFAAVAGTLSWTFTTLAVAAKTRMASVADYMVLETGFTFVQFALAAPLLALAWRKPHANR